MTGYVRVHGQDWVNSYAPEGRVVEIDYGLEDCPRCGGNGEIYTQNKPYPDGPCIRCGGRRTGTTWVKGSGTVARRR